MMWRESFDWMKPAPLWDGGVTAARAGNFFQPQLLEFDDDNFVDAFRRAATAGKPDALKAAVRVATQGRPLKLYQPAHGRFYLLCAALSCRMPGFPERVVDVTEGESVSFVIRRITAGAEYAWVVDGKSKGWKPLDGQPRRVLDNEERLPLFHTTAADKRTILVGYVPTASRELYSISIKDLNSAVALDPVAKAKFPNGIDLRLEELQARFTTPLKKYVAQVHATPAVSVYMLLDLWEFFDTYLKDVAQALLNPGSGFTGAKAAAKQQLMTFLAGQTAGGGPKLDAALRLVAQKRDALNVADQADAALQQFSNYDLTAAPIDTTTLETRVRAALPADETSTVQLPRQGSSPADTYVLRCVYERPQCTLTSQVVSQPSVPFELAPFFDADAPARPVRIVLPTDVSLAGMRKFQKGVTFMVSNSLQKKINRLTGHEQELVKDGTVGPESDDGLAWMCSFSIQIIFIVAFFLLLMFVIILNICFWWIAFFKICIPIPKKMLSG
jgi:hypothetical protein